MLLGGVLAVLVTMGLALTRAYLGPRLYNRILAINMFGTKTVLFLAVAGFLLGRPAFALDIALFYALVNFVGTIAVLRLTHYHEPGAQLREEPSREETP